MSEFVYKIKKCCNDMERYWKMTSFIQLSNTPVRVAQLSDSAYGRATITYCPWCGTKIEIEKFKTILEKVDD